MSPSCIGQKAVEPVDQRSNNSRSTDITLTVRERRNWLETHSSREVVFPEWSELFLAADVPYCELHVLILHLLDVEAWPTHIFQ